MTLARSIALRARFAVFPGGKQFAARSGALRVDRAVHVDTHLAPQLIAMRMASVGATQRDAMGVHDTTAALGTTPSCAASASDQWMERHAESSTAAPHCTHGCMGMLFRAAGACGIYPQG